MMETEGKKYLFTPTFLKKMGVNREQIKIEKQKRKWFLNFLIGNLKSIWWMP